MHPVGNIDRTGFEPCEAAPSAAQAGLWISTKGWTRTSDLSGFNRALFHLSYQGKCPLVPPGQRCVPSPPHAAGYPFHCWLLRYEMTANLIRGTPGGTISSTITYRCGYRIRTGDFKLMRLARYHCANPLREQVIDGSGLAQVL